MSVLAIGRAIAVASMLLLAGCASLPSQPLAERDVASSAATRGAARKFHPAIDLAGRLSVRYQGPSNEEALHGSFQWTQTPAQTAVTLLSPLGQTLAVIEVTPHGATLSQGGQPVRSASNVDMLTAQTLGWPLPVAGLRNWLQGFALDAGGQPVVASPEHDQVTTIDGWRIRYASWQENSQPSIQSRPKRIDLARYTEQAGEVSIRIVIDSWQAY